LGEKLNTHKTIVTNYAPNIKRLVKTSFYFAVRTGFVTGFVKHYKNETIC
jgi:hypothetical protein